MTAIGYIVFSLAFVLLAIGIVGLIRCSIKDSGWGKTKKSIETKKKARKLWKNTK